NAHKLKQGRLILQLRRNFFPVMTVRQWSREPTEAVQSPSLEVFKTWLDKALSNLV
ncbi:hypothetical protein N308_05767, partial [Struthio camelus australis]